ncbi:aspartate kinase [Kytococcus sp. Marseille-QA3725]
MSVVMKFGGSSVADAARLTQVGELVTAALPHRPLVVLSAAGKTTNALVSAGEAAEAGRIEDALDLSARLRRTHEEIATELLGGVDADLEETFDQLFGDLESLLRAVAILAELSPRSRDAILSTGERLSTRLLSAHLRLPLLDARTLVHTDSRHGAATPDTEAIARAVSEVAVPALEESGAAITQGFIGSDPRGTTTTLGRGGSDYSAALLGAALQVEEVQIWTDVEGVLTCDPRVVPAARSVPELSASEAAELAAFGANVLHPATIAPAMQSGAAVTVRHTHRPEGAFTTIRPGLVGEQAAAAITSRGPVTVLTVSSPRMLDQTGFMQRLFEVFAAHDVSIGLIATAEVSVSVTLDAASELDGLLRDLGEFATVEVSRDRVIIAVVGERLKTTPGLAARVFTSLEPVANIELISQGANDVNLSVVIRGDRRDDALRALHAGLFEDAREA